MPKIILPFTGYPHKTARFDGEAEIISDREPIVCDDTKGLWFVPSGRLLSWRFGPVKVGIRKPDLTDLHAFIRGRYWPVIDTLLIAKLMADQGYGARAQAYMDLAQNSLAQLQKE